jgi:GT2 family glycosyltransferase
MLLTISIIVMGDQPLVLTCLESIEAQTKTEHEIFLVDNLASPSLIKEIAHRFPQVKFIHNSRHLSFAANNNQIMQRSQGEFILLLNDDTVILDSALDRMIEFLSSQPPEVGIAGCTNLNRQNNFTLSCYPFPDAKGIIWQITRLGRWLPGYGLERYLIRAKKKEPFSVDWVAGSCMLIRREVVERIGYLDENFFLYSEEVDYCYRARQAGFLVYQVPEAHIIHYESITTSRVVPLKIQGHYLGKLYFLAKHGFSWDLRLVRVCFIVELLAKSVVRGIETLTGCSTDSKERLAIYQNLIRICATYRGQPALDLIQWK